jgi:hypothetical protein
MQRNLDEIVDIAYPREGLERRAVALRLARNVRKRPLIGDPAQGLRAHVIGRLALRDRREPPLVGELLDRREGVCHILGTVDRASGTAGKRHEAVGRAFARLRVRIGPGDAAENRGISDPGDRRTAHSRVGVRFGYMAYFDWIIEIFDGLESDGGIDVFPARLRLELVEKSHNHL